MHISTITRYGLRAAVRLADISRDNGRLVSVADIAKAESISVKYLEAIFSILKRHNIISAVRGKNGGYRLTRPMNKISLLEIVEALGGKIGPVDCVTDKNFCSAKNRAACTAYPVWREVHQGIKKILDDKTLEDLVTAETN